MQEYIVVKGAREHNLKNITVKIPRGKFTVITGISGSGKSTLAFDTIFAEGQRRYVESLSSYARQFLGQLEKPDVDYIEGLSPAISIDQKTTSRNPRSTVATTTEIYDYLRVLFANIGIPHCPKCGRKIEKQSLDQIVDKIFNLPEGDKVQILAPVVRGRKGEFRVVLEEIRKAGFVKVRINGKTIDLSEDISLEKFKKHSIEVIIDRVIVTASERTRINEAVELALKIGKGIVLVNNQIFSDKFACGQCDFNLEEITPRFFSFNSPYGACKKCSGLGNLLDFDPDLLIPNKELTVNQGAFAVWSLSGTYYGQIIEDICLKNRINMNLPIKSLSQDQLNIILYGHEKSDSDEKGIISHLKYRYHHTQSDHVRFHLRRFMNAFPCESCCGKRLKPEVLAVTINEKSISNLTELSVNDALIFFNELKLNEREFKIADRIIKEIKGRLNFLASVGLDYLTLDRPSGTLAGGEAQRIRLATQIGSGLVGVLYILDEPSIGLHQRDNKRLINMLIKLKDLGNTLVVVEHDEQMIRCADHIIDIGPGAGKHGGEIVASGSLKTILGDHNSLTGKYLKGTLSIPTPKVRRKKNSRSITVKKASEHNLKNIDVAFPLGLFICVTGVSGSGKSTLVHDILYRGLSQKIYRSIDRPGVHETILGTEFIDKVIIVDQSPIGRTPRSNPATYTSVFTPIREVFTNTQDAKIRGYKTGRFSFNVAGGRCETCLGDGVLKIEMHFLPDVYITCDTCKGRRYNNETLEVKYRGKNIAEVLNMTVEEACRHFENIPVINEKLKTLSNVGLGYIHLGQNATTLSGGEAQRVKLATELSKRATGRTLYILDEPTTGLHFADIQNLLNVLNRLVDTGNTVIIIEHNLDVIKTADYVVDLGPEGGEQGGFLVSTGTPEEITANEKSYTGQFLKKVLNS